MRIRKANRLNEEVTFIAVMFKCALKGMVHTKPKMLSSHGFIILTQPNPYVEHKSGSWAECQFQTEKKALDQHVGDLNNALQLFITK